MRHLIEYVDSCLTLEILKQDSGLLPKPREDWNTFIPKLGDIAYVDQFESEFIFNGETWIKLNELGEEESGWIEPIFDESGVSEGE